jgi:tripartite-type tricarboxylate transporter receptor subunit TctC
VIENRPGAGSTIAATAVARADKDGYTAYLLNSGHTVSAVMYKSLQYDSVKDFQPVSLVATAGLIVVSNKNFPAKDLKELIAKAKAEPGKLDFATVGVGSTQHFSAELLRQSTGIDIKHIPYRGTPAAMTAVVAGEIPLLFELVQPVLGQVRAGELKALAVTSTERWPALPDVPTAREQGVSGYDVTSWYGLVFPAGTPAPIVAKTNAALRKVLAMPEIQEKIAAAGALVKASTPEELGKHIEDEIAKWRVVRDKAGIEPQQQ